MKRYLCLILLILLFVSCTGKSTQQEKPELTKEKLPQIGILFDTFVVERWQRDRDIFVSTARELGAEVLAFSAGGSVDEQVSQMEHLIELKVDVIVVVPINSKPLAALVRQAKNAGIKVMSYDRMLENCNSDIYISFDSQKVGTLMAQALDGVLEKGDNVIMICGSETDANTHMVEKGFTEQMSNQKMNISDIYYTEGWKAEYSAQYIRDNAEKVKQAKAIMCGNDNLATLAVQALAELQLAGSIKIVAQDADITACQRIVEGTQTATVYKAVDKLAATAAGAAVDLALGYTVKTDKEINDGTYAIPSISLDPILITKDNLDKEIIESGFHLREDIYIQ